MYYVVTSAPPQSESPAEPDHAPRRKKRRNPAQPPPRILAAMNYLYGINDVVLRPRFERGSRHGVLEEGESWENLIQQDLHPRQTASFQAACDCLQRYFDGEEDE